MKIGDIITGKDRSYPRSIYKLVLLEPFTIEFVSFQGRLNNGRYPFFTSLKHRCKLENYRLATEEEIEESKTVRPYEMERKDPQ